MMRPEEVDDPAFKWLNTMPGVCITSVPTDGLGHHGFSDIFQDDISYIFVEVIYYKYKGM